MSRRARQIYDNPGYPIIIIITRWNSAQPGQREKQSVTDDINCVLQTREIVKYSSVYHLMFTLQASLLGHFPAKYCLSNHSFCLHLNVNAPGVELPQDGGVDPLG